MKRSLLSIAALAVVAVQIPINAAAATTAPVSVSAAEGSASQTGLGVGTFPPGGGSGQSVRVRADGWIEYPSVLTRAGVSKASLASSRTVKVPLKRVSGACIDEGLASAPPGESVYVEETAYDPASCTMEITTTKLTPADVALVCSVGGGQDVYPHAVQAAGRGYGNMSSSWIDPVNITIASQSLYLSWLTATGAPVLYEPHRYGFAAPLITPAGTTIYDVTYLTSSSASLVGNKYKATAHFRNDTFYWWVLYSFGPAGEAVCLNPSSNVAFFNFEDTIWGSGTTVYGSWNDTKSGACTNLVHHGALVSQGWPT